MDLRVGSIEKSLQGASEVAFSVSIFKDSRDYVLLGFNNDENVVEGLKGYSKLLEFFKGYECDLVIQPKIYDGLNIVVKCEKLNEFILIPNLKYDPISLQLFTSHLPRIEKFALIIGINPADNLINAMGNTTRFILSKYEVAWDI